MAKKERRSGEERRSETARRKNKISVDQEKRSGKERRVEKDRRKG